MLDVKTCKNLSYFPRDICCWGITAISSACGSTHIHTHTHAHTAETSTAPVHFTGSALFLCWPYLSLPAVVIEECLYLPLLLSITANTSGQVLALLCHSNTHRQCCRSCNPESMSWLSVYPPPPFHPCIILLFILIMWSVLVKTSLLCVWHGLILTHCMTGCKVDPGILLHWNGLV